MNDTTALRQAGGVGGQVIRATTAAVMHLPVGLGAVILLAVALLIPAPLMAEAEAPAAQGPTEPAGPAATIEATVPTTTEPATAPALREAALPEGELAAQWPSRPAEVLTDQRAQIDLDGLWKFVPAEGPTLHQPAGYGYARVPGSWNRDAVLLRGEGGPWEQFDGPRVGQAWYEKDVAIPADWAGRAVELILDRVSTDAVVYVNDQEAGQVRWPAGRVEIASHLRPGEVNRLRLRVIAVADAQAVDAIIAHERAPEAEGGLEHRGLIGSVRLLSRPAGGYVADVLVRPSTRRQRLEVDLELADVPANGEVALKAEMLDESGAVEKSFEQTIAVSAGAQTVTAGWDWPDPRLWDVGKPNRYTMRLALSGAVEDAILQPFGFREFWIEGRRFLLNGTEIRLRPNTLHEGATPQQLLERSYTFGELWPGDRGMRGSDSHDDRAIAEADRVGLLVGGKAMHMEAFAGDIERWRNDPAVREAYRRLMELDLRRWRNSPSVVMWGHSGNIFQNPRGGDPWLLGKAGWSVSQAYGERHRNVAEAVAMIKAVDPTRPVYAHHGTYHGDVYTANLFLNFLPLQEREEYISEWVRNGQMPFMAVQFGMPLYASLMRGRGGYEQAGRSEPLMTEWVATYLGAQAYALEPPEYRKLMHDRYHGADAQREYAPHLRQGSAERIISGSPGMRKVYELFARNTWRSWRTLGITGGMVPWHHDDTNDVPALRQVNGPTLAWIAGAGEAPLPGDEGLEQAEALTDKVHSYPAGGQIRKQIALINDHRQAVPATYQWRVLVGGQEVGAGASESPIELQPAETRLLPIEAALPEAVEGKTGGRIELTARIGETEHQDAFDFQVFPPVAPAEGTLTVFDPAGETAAMLESLGYTLEPWTEGEPAGQVVVIGRKALSDGHVLPGPIAKYIREGGRVILFAQDPRWMRWALQLRTAPHAARRVFRVDPEHPVVAGLDDNDLRDWAGQSRLIPAYPYYGGYEGTPVYGWHWGNRGAVSSAPIEIPHRSGIRAMLRCEWDMAYSPLLELDHVRGRLTICTLDLEDHVQNTPAARQLARQLMEHVRSGPVTPRARGVIYLGDDGGARLLEWLGVRHTRAEAMASDAELVIVGEGAEVRDEQLAAYAGRGGHVLVLRHNAAGTGPLGVKYEQVSDFAGSLNPPAWPETAGLTASDLRWRSTWNNVIVRGEEKIEAGADGQFGRMAIGQGAAIFAQISPEAVPADEKRFFRYTRWRQTRALAQVLANMGASFHHDDRLIALIEKPDQAWLLAGEWDARLTKPRPERLSGEAHEDPGISDFARQLVQVDAPLMEFETVPVPANMEAYEGQWTWADGEAVFRRTIEVPPHLEGRELLLSLGQVRGSETVFFNGEQVGESTQPHQPRGHRIPGRLVQAGTNVLSIRHWNPSGPGGLVGPPESLFLRPVAKPANLYHDDYIPHDLILRDTEQEGPAAADRARVADDPYRYGNW